MNTPAAPAAKTVGREQTCDQCSAVYHARRVSARYCSNACRVRAQRGTASLAHRSNPSTFSIIGRALIRLGLAGPLGPVSTRATEPMFYGLTVPRSNALAELQLVFDRKGWGHVSEAEFSEALTSDGLRAYSTDSPAAAERKRLQARQRVATARLAKAA